MGTPNWGKLKEQGRCKEIGIPWNQVEMTALHTFNIPADYVRRGCLTPDEYEEMLAADEAYIEKNGEKPLDLMSKAELLEKAEQAEVEVTNQVTEDGLRGILSNLTKPKKKAAKEVAPKKKTAKA